MPETETTGTVLHEPSGDLYAVRVRTREGKRTIITEAQGPIQEKHS